ncbi:MAG: hypothetical protein AAGA75_22860 [Cyanobacteria bacterium P01_E01_bin.6]
MTVPAATLAMHAYHIQTIPPSARSRSDCPSWAIAQLGQQGLAVNVPIHRTQKPIGQNKPLSFVPEFCSGAMDLLEVISFWP